MMQSLHPVVIFASIRKKLYTTGWFKSIKLPVPVISVGNIVFGGSGKTPFILWFLERYSNQYKIAVICHAYRAESTRPARVDLSQPDPAREFGDEAVLIKTKFPNVEVWSGPSKSDTAQFAVQSQNQNKPYDFILVDDGFTHHRIKRDLDLVLVDLSRELNHYRLPPFGQLREPIQGLVRADVILFTKFEGEPREKSDFFQVVLKNWSGQWGWVQAQTKIASRYSSASGGPKYLLFSGVGNFQYVQKSAQMTIAALPQKSFTGPSSSVNPEILKAREFANHTEYSPQLQEQLAQELKAKQLRGLTTLKDLVKIQNKELLEQTDLLELQFQLDENTTSWLDEKIRSLL